jgi:Na+/H+ antiporter NhaA
MRDFFKRDSAPGVLLACATLLALAASNSAALPLYRHFVDLDLGAQIFALKMSKPLLLWVNDGLMAICFSAVAGVMGAAVPTAGAAAGARTRPGDPVRDARTLR